MELRAGLVGFGMMGRNHARVLSSLDRVSLVGVADPVASADPPDNTTTYVPTVEDLLELGIDMCVVACPTEDHETVALTLASDGVHCLVEKPLSTNLESARRIYEAFQAAHLVGAVGHIERFNPAVRAMRERLAADQLGDVYQIATRRVGPFPSRIRDVGVVKDLATHDLDLTAWVGGAAYSAIAAFTASKAGRQHEDLLAASGSLANGVITNHLVNWLSPNKERVVIATGERGSLVADTLLADLTFYENGEVPVEWSNISGFRGVSEGDVTRYAIAKPEPLRTELEAFRDAIVDGSPGIVTMHDGMSAVAAADAAIRSSESRHIVHLLDQEGNQ